MFEQENALILDQNAEVVLTIKKNNGLYYVQTEPTEKVYTAAETWHKRLGHLNLEDN